ncbi:MAG TPA: protein phosphatase 2C domain-containing protein [Verrucomicrobiae bacterium]|jgi:protein phosphatase|nr:protein phosphatase 2C domain-containing protein [Verrucomicrobiae bacterium]
MQAPPPTAAPAHVQWFGWTDRGKVRPNNEDSFLGLQFDAREVHRLGKTGALSLANADCAFAVSDGMGGAKAGEFASRIAVEKITTLLPRSFKQSAIGLSAGFPDILMELFGEIHRALTYVGASYSETRGMEATLTLCWFTPGWAYFGHIGDSRLYYRPARENRIQQLTQDDTHVAWLLRHGQITEHQARTHPRRNVLQKALGGSNQFVEPQVGAIACEPGDVFLLCTDGLVKGLYEHHLLDMLHPSAPRESNRARALVDAALANDGSDNTTAVVVQTLAEPPPAV